jgi:hypothetical protein
LAADVQDMIAKSNIDVLETLRKFKNLDIPVSFLVPTPTAMDKSIIDATKGVRTFLKDSGLHDYGSQLQGPANKIYIETTILSNGKLESTKSSLYKPETKYGDPRIWIYGLKEVADATDLLALIAVDKKLIVINCSKSDLEHVISSKSEFLAEFLSSSVIGLSDVALELLEKLFKIYEKGYVTTLRAGDTGVGFTLETLLGISANSSQAPDYNGIELKAGRTRSHKSGRTTIFSQVPNWKISRLKGSKELLRDRGRYNEDKQRRQLFHEMSVIKVNSYDLQLRIDEGLDQLTQIYTGVIPPVVDVRWDFDKLIKRLVSKHRETFWITAQTQGSSKDVDEKFRYSKIKHTGNVDLSAFAILLELGVITLDYTIKETPTGAAKDQGYLFKIAQKNLDLLFSRVDEYDFSKL